MNRNQHTITLFYIYLILLVCHGMACFTFLNMELSLCKRYAARKINYHMQKFKCFPFKMLYSLMSKFANYLKCLIVRLFGQRYFDNIHRHGRAMNYQLRSDIKYLNVHNIRDQRQWASKQTRAYGIEKFH